MKWIAPILLCGIAFCHPAAAHEITFSHVDVRLGPGETLITVQLPVKALLHEQPSPLPAGTDATALRTVPLPTEVKAALSTLVTTRLHIEKLTLEVTSVEPAGDNVALILSAPAIPGALEIEANLFPGDALHKIFVTVYRGKTLAGQYALDRLNPGFRLATPERPLAEIITTFAGQGIRHIFIGQDHILFVLALILLGGSLWSPAKIITTFTIAHSITLTLAVLNIVQLRSRLVESVIALSIVVADLHDLRQL